MYGRALFFAFSAALLTTSARADFSRQWQEYAAEIKADCAAFESTLPLGGGFVPSADGQLKMPTIPRGAPMRPYMCIFVRFDVNGDGETENVETIYKGPDNLHFVFVRKAEAAVKDWRFQVSETRPEGHSNLYTRINYTPLGGRRYEIRFNIRNGDHEPTQDATAQEL